MQPIRKRTRRSLAGYTLVEIMIVVAIIGMLAAIALPSLSHARRRSTQTAFINDLRVFGDAADYFTMTTGSFLEDTEAGQLPAGFEGFVRTGKWISRTPIGGQWKAQRNQGGIASAIGVNFSEAPAPGDAFMREIDAMYDDGDLSTGNFRKIADNQYVKVIAE